MTNGPILNYYVTYTRVGSGVSQNVSTGSGDNKNILLTGLISNTSYQMFVTAENDHGVGVASGVVMAMTPPISRKCGL